MYKYVLVVNCLECSGKMNFNSYKAAIINSLRELVNELDGVYGIYGFGYFFRNNVYNDVDILVVSRADSDMILYEYLRKEFQQLELFWGINFDMCFLSYNEYLRKPLLESNQFYVISEF